MLYVCAFLVLCCPGCAPQEDSKRCVQTSACTSMRDNLTGSSLSSAELRLTGSTRSPVRFMGHNIQHKAAIMSPRIYKEGGARRDRWARVDTAITAARWTTSLRCRPLV